MNHDVMTNDRLKLCGLASAKRGAVIPETLADERRLVPPSRVLWLRHVSKTRLAQIAHAIEETGEPGTREWSRRKICHVCGQPYLVA